MSKTLTLSGLRRLIQLALSDHAIETADLESRLIIEEASGLSRSDQILAAGKVIAPELESKALLMLNRRLDGEPLDHIFGYREFYGLRFEINRHVLSPRPETEMLVDFILTQTAQDQAFRFLDLGTGSGAVAISMLANRPKAKAIATDISAEALAIAQQNADIHNVSHRLSLIRGDWAEALSGHFDFIVSNPPYIDSNSMMELSREVRDYDPVIALHGGDDGLEAYRIILGQSKSLLNRAGKIAVEIGYDQGESVFELFKDQGYHNVTLQKDLAGQPRMITADATD